MPILSPARAQVPQLKGIKLVHRGKVRDTYNLGNGLLLVVCSDGISIFDFVLSALVPGKGVVLTAMTHYWFALLHQHGINTHFVAAGKAIDQYLPSHLRDDTSLQSRAMVVRKLKMHPAEFIGRICITGSVVGEYNKTGRVYGTQLPPGLKDGDLLPFILDTPTTKAEEGHDLPLEAADIRKKYPEETFLLLKILQIIASAAKEKNILFADSKLEFGLDEQGKVAVGDEVATPDSSRWWDYGEWQKSRKGENRKAPPPFDKQLVRAWGIEQGLNDKKQFDPENPMDVVRAHQLVVPEELVKATVQTYRYIFWRLTGMTVEEYLDNRVGVPFKRPKKNLVVLLGSDSDLGALKGALANTNGAGLNKITTHVISCHRNPDTLRGFVDGGCGKADAVIAAGGVAFALPGVLDALIHNLGNHTPVVGVALGAPGSEDLLAAQLSISKLPGQPVVMDEVNGRVYTGPEGFRVAYERVLYGELPPPKVRPKKPAQLNVDDKANAAFFYAGT